MKRWLPNLVLLGYAVVATGLLVTTRRGARDLSAGDSSAHPPRTRIETLAAFSALPHRSQQEQQDFSISVETARATVPPTASHPAEKPSATASFQAAPAGENARVLALRKEAEQIVATSAERVEEARALRRLPESVLTTDDILFLAEAVDNEANSRLRKVAERYALTEAQQDRAFRIYAGASAAYHPALAQPSLEPSQPTAPTEPEQPGGLPEIDAGDQEAVDELIHDILDEEQQDAFEDDWVDRDLWWTEIIGQLDDDLDEELAADDDQLAVIDTPGDDDAGDNSDSQDETEPEDHIGGNLFDLLGQ